MRVTGDSEWIDLLRSGSESNFQKLVFRALRAADVSRGFLVCPPLLPRFA
jgi:hypothetical protein